MVAAEGVGAGSQADGTDGGAGGADDSLGGAAELDDRPAACSSDSLQLTIGIDCHRVSDQLQHRKIAHRVAVAVAERQVIAAQLKLFGQALKLWRGEAARATLRGMLAGVLGIPKMLRKRKIIESRRVVSQDELFRLMNPPYEIALQQDLNPTA